MIIIMKSSNKINSPTALETERLVNDYVFADYKQECFSQVII